jgi:hypothetical protein
MTTSDSLPAPPSSHPIGDGVRQPQRLPKPQIRMLFAALGDGGSGLRWHCLESYRRSGCNCVNAN